MYTIGVLPCSLDLFIAQICHMLVFCRVRDGGFTTTTLVIERESDVSSIRSMNKVTQLIRELTPKHGEKGD